MKFLSEIIRGVYKLLHIIHGKSQFPMTLTFKKEDDRWYIDLPHYPGPKAALEMVLGADKFCEYLADWDTTVSVKVSPEPFEDYEGVLNYIECNEVSGAWYEYKDTGVQMSMWLCDVCIYVIGYFPKKIYFKVV